MATKFHYILTTRLLKNPASRNAIKPLIKDLYGYIQKYPGFVYGKSFWGKNGAHMYTLTKWDRLEDWKNWNTSKEREEVLKRHYHSAIEVYEDIIDRYEDGEVVYGENVHNIEVHEDIEKEIEDNIDKDSFGYKN